MILRIPPGWSSSEAGYFLSESALQLLVADAESWEQTSLAWEKAYDELHKKHQQYIIDTRERLQALKEEIESERTQWKRKVRAERVKPGFGIFAGYGITGWTAGVGVVWRVM